MDNPDFVLSGIKILIIDDQPDVRELTKRVLTLYHPNVIAAATAVEGLEQLQTHRPDVIVSVTDTSDSRCHADKHCTGRGAPGIVTSAAW